jgi:alginate O-acetyltransferase complex protein AlgI
MVFSSTVFLWIFLPIVFTGYFILRNELKNIFLLLASLIFYAWGEPIYVFLMIISIFLNYLCGLIINNLKTHNIKKIILVVSLGINIGLLAYFKYFNFIIENFNRIFQSQISIGTIALPIGISFYTFQAMSYIIDLYRGETRVQKNIINFALYKSFFPQLIAGPIIKYHDIEPQLKEHPITLDVFCSGIKRFTFGLAKKVLIANTLAAFVDSAFSLQISSLGTMVSWITIIAYTLQIYFDFSGYSDMAIGLAQMFGFQFKENFNYPYISSSIKEFWRRWHISLSTWFKEYLYIPLGGNRKGKGRTLINLLIVFFITGLWHGASWNFVFWGLFHGCFLVLERTKFGELLQRNPYKILNHVYTMLIVMVGWVFFRSDKMSIAFGFIKNLFIPTKIGIGVLSQLNINNYFLFILVVAILLAGPLQLNLKIKKFIERQKKLQLTDTSVVLLLLVFSMMMVLSSTYNPFIYFRF